MAHRTPIDGPEELPKTMPLCWLERSEFERNEPLFTPTPVAKMDEYGEFVVFV